MAKHSFYKVNGAEKKSVLEKLTPDQILTANKLDPTENVLINVTGSKQLRYDSYIQRNQGIRVSGKSFVSEAIKTTKKETETDEVKGTDDLDVKVSKKQGK